VGEGKVDSQLDDGINKREDDAIDTNPIVCKIGIVHNYSPITIFNLDTMEGQQRSSKDEFETVFLI
jgi:hypothetical protein